jgi:hypothetical protein
MVDQRLSCKQKTKRFYKWYRLGVAFSSVKWLISFSPILCFVLVVWPRCTYLHFDLLNFRSHLSALFKSIVGPHLEYGSNVWSVIYRKEAMQIENLQRRATTLVKFIQHLSYTERLPHIHYSLWEAVFSDICSAVLFIYLLVVTPSCSSTYRKNALMLYFIDMIKRSFSYMDK